MGLVTYSWPHVIVLSNVFIRHAADFITLAASSGKRNVTVWRPSVRPSVCLFRGHTHHDLPLDSMRCGQRTFRPDNAEDRHICFAWFCYSLFLKIFFIYRVW